MTFKAKLLMQHAALTSAERSLQDNAAAASVASGAAAPGGTGPFGGWPVCCRGVQLTRAAPRQVLICHIRADALPEEVCQLRPHRIQAAHRRLHIHYQPPFTGSHHFFTLTPPWQEGSAWKQGMLGGMQLYRGS